MNNTITLLTLCKQLQEKLPYEIESEKFIASFISAINKALAKDGSVTINGLGQFIILKSDSLDDKNNVDAIRFIPDSELADTVNQPFAFFDAVELEDEVTEDELINNDTISSIESISGKLQENDSQAKVVLTNEDKLNSSDNNEIDSTLEEIFDEDIEQPESQSSCGSMQAADHKKTDIEEADNNKPFVVTITDNQNGSDVDNSTANTEQQETTSFDNPFKVEDYATDDESKNGNNPPEENEQYNNDEEKEENSNLSWLWLVIFFVVGLVIGWCIPTFISNPTVVEEVFIYDTIYVDKPIVKDSIDISSNPVVQEPALTQKMEVQTKISENKSEIVESQTDKKDAVITETVKPNNTLISMALRHYGHRDFWAYIYIENQDKLGNPDMIRSGQVLVIPPASKYGIDKNSKESLEKASKKCKEILNKYKK